MKKILIYYPLRFYFFLHALLPLPLLYVLSDIFYFLLFYIVRYRRRVTVKNIRSSFPDWNSLKVKQLEKRFYRVFCDYAVESIKLMSISDREMKRRMVFENLELPERLLRSGRSILLVLGHYGMWEWIPSVSCHIDQRVNYTLGQIYRPLKNRWFDLFYLKLRARFGTVCISKQDTLRSLVRMKASGRPFMIGFMSDQSPSPNNIHYWTRFLGQDTPVYTGVEKIAKKLDCAVVYLDVCPLKRGYYKGEFRLITETPKETPVFEITERYIREMERTILRAPEYWLWSHNRWKHKHLKNRKDEI